MGAFASVAHATFPGANGRIAFVGEMPIGSGVHIYTALPSGHDRRQLTNSRNHDFEPSWSADGNRIVFLRRIVPPDRAGYVQVFLMSADGANQTRITHDHGNYSSPSFSPNGGRIIAARQYPGPDALITFRKNGTDPRVIVRGDVDDPAYSPDGRWIAFSGAPEGRRQGIWVIHPNGSGIRRLTVPPRHPYLYYHDIGPDWSPDGERILFQRCEDSQYGCSYESYLIPIKGSGREPAPGYGEVFSPSGHRYAGTWSQGDQYSGDDCEDIVTTDAIGSPYRFVTDNCERWESEGETAFAFSPSWQSLPGG